MNHCSIAYTFYESDYRVRRCSEAFAGPGNRVDVIALKGDGAKGRGVLNGVNIYRIQRRNFDEKGPFSYLFKILSFFIKGSVLLLFNHLKYRYKVIHIHSVPDFLVFMALIPKLLGARIILDIHDVLPEFYCQKFGRGFNTMLAKSLLFVEKMSVRFADHVIIANDLWRDKILTRDRVSREKCTSLLNYPNLEFFKEKQNTPKSNGLRIIYPGSLSHHHGLDVAIKALHIVKEELPSVRLDIYAHSWISEYRKSLNDLIDELDLKENVKFFHPVKVEELARIYQKVDIGIVPKRAGLFASQAFSTKIFDFMASGIPIIASKTQVDEYYFNDSMIMFFEPENVEELARCIIKLHKDPKKGQSMAQNAKKFIANNNWGVKKHIYLDLIDFLTDKYRYQSNKA
ncbi:MAG: glycosyltransferase family 4 protein [Thermodesulfobacteriota bacterium]|nr:glycosyltransferase family 4 protein [Thermodesulfobacteriota bacterium]